MKKQFELNLEKGTHGGRRNGSGRKRTIARGVDHKKRESISSREPMHINLKFIIPVRNEVGLKAIQRSIQNARKYLNILHYSLQFNHIHLIVEAKNNEELSQGMRSFSNTFVKLMGKGSIQKQRYHLHVLKNVKETQNAFQYVIFNEIHHSKKQTIRADLFNSLHQLNVREISKEYKLSIFQPKNLKVIDLDQPTSWLGKQGLKLT